MFFFTYNTAKEHDWVKIGHFRIPHCVQTCVMSVIGHECH